jgi:hypothetical protein
MSHPIQDQNLNISRLCEIAFDVDTDSKQYSSSERDMLRAKVIQPLQQIADILRNSSYGCAAIKPNWDELDRQSMRASVHKD